MNTGKIKRRKVSFLEEEQSSSSEDEVEILFEKGTNRDNDGEDSGDSSEKEAVRKRPDFKTVQQIYYDCPTCPKVRNYDCWDYATHLGIHQRRPYRCQICNEFFVDDETSWKSHQIKHSDRSPTELLLRMDWSPGLIYKCEGYRCLGFSTESERDLHEQTCAKAKQCKNMGESSQRSCSLCPEMKFRNYDEWRFHRVLEHPEVDHVSCPFCSESFLEKTVEGVEERNDLKLHNHIHQSHYAYKKGSKLYENCESCGLVFRSITKTMAHFKEKHGLDEKCYICRICGRGYTEPESLRRHVQAIHFRPESVFCEVCGDKLKSEGGLVEHKFRKHQINENKLSVKTCPKEGCGYQCLLPKTLNSHQSFHKAKDNVCEECGKKFKWISELYQHQLVGHLEGKVTTNVKNPPKIWNNFKSSKPKVASQHFNCPSCPEVKNYNLAAFAQHLTIHRRRPYKCTKCSEFLPSDKTAWENHWISQHSLSIYNFATESEAATFVPFNPGPLYGCGGFRCKTRFLTETERDSHSKDCVSAPTSSSKPSKELKTCKVCQKVCKNDEEWRIHRLLEHPHVDWISCPFCDLTFSAKVEEVEERNDGKLFQHLIRMHQQGSNAPDKFRLFAECHRCGIIFKSEREMKEHFETKHGIRDGLFYFCRLCETRCPTTDKLLRHLSSVHFSTEGFHCKVDGCSVKFLLESTLIDHNFLVHGILPEEKYKLKNCPYEGCDFKCFFSKQMENHRINHRPLDKMCEVCGRGFRRAGDLRKHVELHKNDGTGQINKKRIATASSSSSNANVSNTESAVSYINL